MAFSDVIQSFLKSRATDDSQAQQLVESAIELYERLDVDANDVGAFEELAGIIRQADESPHYVDPLRGDEENEEELSADLVLWALSEEIGSASDAWYPLTQLARLSVEDDSEGAIRYLEIASDREDTGLALTESIKVLREAGLNEAAIQIGLGRWQPQTQVTSVAEELVESALASNKPAEARTFVERLREVGADQELVDDLSLHVATAE